MTDVEAFPLQWPFGWERTPSDKRKHAQFKQTLATARDGLIAELERMGARRHQITISTNIPLRRDGLPYSGKANPEDPGVAVYFLLNGVQKCIPCDKWTYVEDNLQAIRLTVAALRGLDRWGAKQMMDAAFAGFDALPERSETGWWVTLGVSRDAPWNDVVAAYRAAVKATHPDTRGDAERFMEVQEAWSLARDERGMS